MRIFKATRTYEQWLREELHVVEDDPALKVYEDWVVRRLAPDSRRIELVELGPERDEEKMMYAMGWETGNIHLGTPAAVDALLDDLNKRKKKWLVKAAKKMAEATLKDWKLWKKG